MLPSLLTVRGGGKSDNGTESGSGSETGSETELPPQTCDIRFNFKYSSARDPRRYLLQTFYSHKLMIYTGYTGTNQVTQSAVGVLFAVANGLDLDP
jgi:hypothetical protein